MAWQENCHVKKIDLGLQRVSSVYKRLKTSTSKKPYTITVAGTNGKGSCVAFLESILLAEGYRVGVYSTPHLLCYNERVRVNGEAVSDASLTEAFSRIDKAREKVSLSYFEFGTLAALTIFEKQDVDIQILEVGLGGRLDAVNIIDANAALITSIDIDHVAWLGNDRSVIAVEKAGVFRKNQKAICADKTVPNSLPEFAAQLKTDLKLSGVDYKVEKDGDIWRLLIDHELAGDFPIPSLKGEHQIQNAAGVVALLAHVSDDIPVQKTSVLDGLQNTFLPGRLQLVGTAPDIYLDVAHNRQSAVALAKFIKCKEYKGDIHAVFSILDDKDLSKVTEPFLEFVNFWYIAPLNIDRSEKIECLSEFFNRHSKYQCSEHKSIESAFAKTRQLAKKEDLVICFGSFYVVEACLEGL